MGIPYLVGIVYFQIQTEVSCQVNELTGYVDSVIVYYNVCPTTRNQFIFITSSVIFQSASTIYVQRPPLSGNHSVQLMEFY